MNAPSQPLECSPAGREAVVELCDELARIVGGALEGARRRGALDEPTHAVGRGAGDTTFALDVPTEEAIDRWFDAHAALGPLSLLTEDRGWRHAGPDGRGGARALQDFAHGGPRLVIDPIDGTRNLMHGLRPAWTVVGLAPPGGTEPRLGDLEHGVLAELPPRGGTTRRVLTGSAREGCRLQERALEGRVGEERALRVDGEARVDHGYFPFFRYGWRQRTALAELEARFFQRLEECEGADGAAIWDDQYISNGGQLALIALGRYRMVADLRAWLEARTGLPSPATKPYDCAGAIVVARAAGAIVEAPDGAELDFPLDASTPVSFVAWANEATAQRLRPHLRAALARSIRERRSESAQEPRSQGVATDSPGDDLSGR